MDKDIEAMQESFKWAAEKTLKQIQHVISITVNTRNVEALEFMQAKIGAMFKQASECIEEGKYLEFDDEDKSLH